MLQLDAQLESETTFKLFRRSEQGIMD